MKEHNRKHRINRNRFILSISMALIMQIVLTAGKLISQGSPGLASPDESSLSNGGSYIIPDTIPSSTTDNSKKDKKGSKFDKYSKKAEHLFIYIPVPLYTYSSDAGHTFGLAKFNIINLYKGDSITRPSKISEVVTISTKGRINASIATDLMFRDNKYMILSYFNYKKTPEYIFGIGNDVKREDVEEITTDRVKFGALCLRHLGKREFYLGGGFDISDYFSVETDSNSILVENNVPGLDGGFGLGLLVAAALEGRENRFNPVRGHFIKTTFAFYPEFLGSKYQFISFEVDVRKYFNPWQRHVIALQATTFYTSGDVPFYELAMMGGDEKMRGYYKGALRDKVLVDCQVEYRMPIWNIFGITGWIGTGRVAPDYGSLSLNGFWLSYGFGLRIMVDSPHQTNLRFDFGFGPNGVSGFYINFAEAF